MSLLPVYILDIVFVKWLKDVQKKVKGNFLLNQGATIFGSWDYFYQTLSLGSYLVHTHLEKRSTYFLIHCFCEFSLQVSYSILNVLFFLRQKNRFVINWYEPGERELIHWIYIFQFNDTEEEYSSMVCNRAISISKKKKSNKKYIERVLVLMVIQALRIEIKMEKRNRTERIVWLQVSVLQRRLRDYKTNPTTQLKWQNYASLTNL